MDYLAPDVCVIGAGVAGSTVATAAAAFGVPVVLVEKREMDGERRTAGSLPSKALLAAARRMHEVRAAASFGIRAEGVETDFPAVMRHVREAIAALAPNQSAERLAGLGINVIRGEARFLDASVLAVGDVRVRARRFVIATGARPAIPPIPALETVPILTSNTIFDLKRLPSRLAVLGAGRVGLEFAQGFRRLGSEVVVLEAERALADGDPELVALLLESLRAEGIAIHERTQAERIVRRGRSGIRITVDGEGGRDLLDVSHLLVATGRQPNTENLGLDRAGVTVTARGIEINQRSQTSNRRIHAVGDVVDGPRFAHWATHQAEQVARSILFRTGGDVRSDLLSWTLFTDPELAHVGLGEGEAAARHGRISVLRWPFSENERATAERSTRGLVKIVATRKGVVLGAGILGTGAGELIAPLVLAVARGMNVEDLASLVLPSPTRSEALRRAASLQRTGTLDSPWVGRAIRLLRRLG